MAQAAMMSESTMRLVQSTASRIRLAYESLATAPAETRAARLGEIVHDATNRVAPGERAPFIEALRDLFPTWDGSFRSAPAGSDTRQAVDPQSLQDPNFLVEKLMAIAPSLSEQQRQAVVQALSSGYPVPKPQLVPPTPKNTPAPEPALPSATPVVDGDGLTRLRQVMSVGQISLDSNRVAWTLAHVWDLCCAVDDVAWQIWEITSSQATTRTNIQRKASLRPMLTKVITGDRNVALGTVEPAINQLRGLTVGLLTALGETSRHAKDQCMKLDPERIDSTVRATFSRSSALWDAYRKKFAEVSATISQTVNSEVIKSVEFYLTGR